MSKPRWSPARDSANTNSDLSADLRQDTWGILLTNWCKDPGANREQGLTGWRLFVATWLLAISSGAGSQLKHCMANRGTESSHLSMGCYAAVPWMSCIKKSYVEVYAKWQVKVLYSCIFSCYLKSISVSKIYEM